MGRTSGVVVAGVAPDDRLPLEFLGLPGDVALAPFAVRHRILDVAVSTLHNSGVRDLDVVVADVPGPRAPYRSTVAPPSAGPERLPRVRELTAPSGGRLARILAACAGSRPNGNEGSIVAVAADHVLVADLRALLATHLAVGADVTLACVPVLSAGDAAELRLVLDAEPSGCAILARVGRTEGAPAMALVWTGDLVVRAAALPTLAALAGDDLTVASALVAAGRLGAADLGRDAYWLDPVCSEAYYDAQMALCLPEPPLDLWNPAWPIRAGSVGGTPAKIVSDVSGHPGHVLNSLLGDGTRVCGAEVVRSVLGGGVVVEPGAEVEDALLLDGCRIGRGARVRRAIVGVGAVIGAGEAIGYDDPTDTARMLPSGLTLVPPAAATTLRSAAIRR